ncbi:MAG: hypothetical protein P1R58_07895 [bacterium]|nr:hypothetical protein [bacterium]
MKSSIATLSGEGIDSNLLDLASLVGREVVLYSEQYPGKPLSTRVIMVNNKSMAIDRGKSSGLINELIDSQKVVLQFEYRGELVSVDATLNRSPNGKCTLSIAERVIPLTRRRFDRFPIELSTKLAAFNVKTFDPQNMGKLRWLETRTINFSCGGLLVGMSSQIKRRTYFLLNVDTAELEIPKFMIGEVRHSFQVDHGGYRIGMEFVVNEKKARHFSQFTIQSLPESFFEYTISQRAGIKKQLAAGMPIQRVSNL